MKIIKHLAGLLLLGFFGYIVYPFIVGDENMQVFCSDIRAGELMNAVSARANDSGYSIRAVEGQNKVLIIDSAAMGRFICEVTSSDDKVTSTQYVPNG